jgi:hypothetical protein
MSNILGEVFSDYVRQQVNRRQEVLGKKSLSRDDLNVINTKAPFLRLISSVNLDLAESVTALQSPAVIISQEQEQDEVFDFRDIEENNAFESDPSNVDVTLFDFNVVGTEFTAGRGPNIDIVDPTSGLFSTEFQTERLRELGRGE